ncbi:hypothetical protein APHAL10511_007807 [Amanita phalloides]|nr:hypothetical protein APHAL10511_007807 [Amanita phalloides]
MIAMSKPAYLAILEYLSMRPVIVFVPSRGQCRLLVDDILTHCVTDDKPDQFSNIELEDMQPHLDYLSDLALAESFKHRIGYYHETLYTRQMHRAVIVQVQGLVASKDTAWSIPVASYMVMIMGAQYYEGKEQ